MGDIALVCPLVDGRGLDAQDFGYSNGLAKPAQLMQAA